MILNRVFTIFRFLDTYTKINIYFLEQVNTGV